MKVSEERGKQIDEGAGRIGCWSIVIFVVSLILSIVTQGNVFFIGLTILMVLLQVGCVIAQSKAEKILKPYREARLAAKEEEERKQAELKKEAEQKEKILQFYDRCIEAGIVDLNTEAANQKAKLIAENIGLNVYYTDAYNIGMAEMEKISGKRVLTRKELSRLNELADKELERYKELVKYSSYVGRDKQINMLKDLIAPYRERFEREKEKFISEGNRYNSISSTPLINDLQAKSNPTAKAAVASAIAGDAAGIAVAMHTKQKNDQIDEFNRLAIEARGANERVHRLTADSWNRTCAEMEKKLKPLERSLEKAKIKLVENSDEHEILDNIDISEVTVSFSETGAVTIRAKACLKKNIKIFDNVPAVVDGAIRADVYQHGQCLGSAIMTAPLDGIGSNLLKEDLEGIILSNDNTIEKKEEYNIKFEPYHLWKMER